ncbi:MAG TPA: hypothetical protein VFC52_01390 [Solirubrobacterales bacterium]|nr:hypothetical protein [Solirubrobacterales bacterium]
MKSLTPYVADSAEGSAAGFEVPKGSAIAGDRFGLPAGAEEPITVFVNGVQQRRDRDYRLEPADRPAGAAVVFARPILVESSLGFSRWAALYLGLFGTYRVHESVDVHYRLDGRVRVAADVELE